MDAKKRTRPGGRRAESPKGTNALLPLNAPFPGCCKPYPHARFVDQVMVELHAHHVGSRCKGFMEPMSVEDWNAEIDARSAAGRASGGDER